MKKKIRRSHNMVGSPAAPSSLFTLAACGLGALGVAVLATTKHNEKMALEIKREVNATSSSYQNSIREYVNRVEDPCYLPTATASSFPSRNDIEEEASTQVKKLRFVSNPLCVNIYKMFAEIEAITIAMIRSKLALVSWLHGVPICSPMDLWEECQYFVFGLVFGDDAILLQNQIKEPSDQKRLAAYADDLRLLRSSLMDELEELLTLGNEHSCCSKNDAIKTIRRSSVTVPFMQRIAAAPASPFVTRTALPDNYVTNSALRASVHGSAENLYSLHVSRRNTEEIDEMCGDFLNAFDQLKAADMSTLESGLNNVLNKYARR